MFLHHPPIYTAALLLVVFYEQKSAMDDVLDALCDDKKAPPQLLLSKCEDNCNQILFADLCKKFDEVDRTSGSEKKFKVLFNKNLQMILGGQSVFPLMRLVLPLIDTDREKYG